MTSAPGRLAPWPGGDGQRSAIGKLGSGELQAAGPNTPSIVINVLPAAATLALAFMPCSSAADHGANGNMMLTVAPPPVGKREVAVCTTGGGPTIVARGACAKVAIGRSNQATAEPALAATWMEILRRPARDPGAHASATKRMVQEMPLAPAAATCVQGSAATGWQGLLAWLPLPRKQKIVAPVAFNCPRARPFTVMLSPQLYDVRDAA